MASTLREWAERMQNAQEQAKEAIPKTALQKFAEMRAENVANLPTIGGEFGAMFRGAVKDIRSTSHEAMWSQPEKMSEPGEPLVPTPQLTTAALLGKDVDLDR